MPKSDSPKSLKLMQTRGLDAKEAAAAEKHNRKVIAKLQKEARETTERAYEARYAEIAARRKTGTKPIPEDMRGGRNKTSKRKSRKAFFALF
jgi:hypothetical protein